MFLQDNDMCHMFVCLLIEFLNNQLPDCKKYYSFTWFLIHWLKRFLRIPVAVAA